MQHWWQQGVVMIEDFFGQLVKETGLLTSRWHPKGHLLLASSKDSTIWMWKMIEVPLLTHLIPISGESTCVVHVKTTNLLFNSLVILSFSCLKILHDSDSWAAIGGKDQKLIIKEIEHSLSQSTCDHKDGVTCLAWLGVSNVATSCAERYVRLWDSQSSEFVRTFRGHSDAIRSLSVSANHDYIVFISLDGTVLVFEVEGDL
ncbi:hypothetical protein L6164_026333 [Bauhinia variegata]|uniref:Uncharacterized protein n=1 Tax=Bauhinia variegata TaxID=167791 RepID=A0ACB9LQS7_BAUVA|nr:hypothetical protein L6164_026333 [Bauhinia variegata]